MFHPTIEMAIAPCLEQFRTYYPHLDQWPIGLVRLVAWVAPDELGARSAERRRQQKVVEVRRSMTGKELPLVTGGPFSQKSAQSFHT
jgi:hypothetical protein